MRCLEDVETFGRCLDMLCDVWDTFSDVWQGAREDPIHLMCKIRSTGGSHTHYVPLR